MDLDREDSQTNLFILVLNLKILTENDYNCEKIYYFHYFFYLNYFYPQNELSSNRIRITNIGFFKGK